MPDTLRVDVHQHVWTEPLLDELARRECLPFVRESRGVTVLHCATESPCIIDRAAERPDARAGLLAEDHLDRALVAISSPIGIESLPAAEAARLIDAFLIGVEELGPGFAAWGPLPLETLDADGGADDVDAVLARGAIGVSLPAHAITGHAALTRAERVLDRAAELAAPLFVHPGPVRSAPQLEEPLWWPALTDYVAQMQAAWLSFATLGRRRHPELTVVFAMLAGGAPLLSERLDARGGPPVDLRDPRAFYDTSSYGPAAVAAMARRVGRDRLLYGSDRPVVEPAPDGYGAVTQLNAGRAFAAALAAGRAVV
jgi:predicted TIM-barrel fold metal-dependent hydrolase